MERRPHPTHDRVSARRAAAAVGLLFLSGLGTAATARTGAGDWCWLGLVGVVAGLVVLARVPINKCSCPTCGEQLIRAPFTTEFNCAGCETIWVTRVRGESIFE